MDKRLRKLLIKSVTALIGIISFVILLCVLFLNVTRYAVSVVCIIIPIAIILLVRIVIHTAMYAYLYITFDGSDAKDESEIKVTALISKIDLSSKIITVLLAALVLFLPIIGRVASTNIHKDIKTDDFIDIAVENVDIQSEKYFSNCITDYYSYGEKCNNYTTTLSIEKITNCPKWFIKYHYDKNHSMLDKRRQISELLTVTDANNDRYSCAYVLRDNGTRISIIAMNDYNYIELTASSAPESKISVDTEKALNYVENYFNQ